MTQSLFSAAGLEAIRGLSHHRCLFAFDFDGTLAPIRDRPEDVHIDESLARALAGLASQAPVAVVTGHRVEDVRPRLGFAPSAIYGSRGAESPDHPRAASAWASALAPVRVHLHAARADLARAGVVVEDKVQSIALHYRGAADLHHARHAIDRILAPTQTWTRRFDGKFVVNVVDVAAPDKAAAVREIVRNLASDTVLFVGDDVNDEPVFESAPPHWMTIQVGREVPTSARFHIDVQDEITQAIELMRDSVVGAP